MSGQQNVDKNRVKLTHKVKESGAIKDVEIPWSMGVLMDGYGNHPDSKKTDLYSASFTDVTAHTFEKYIEEAQPKMRLNVKNHLGGGDEDEALVADVTIKSMKDFEPDAIASSVPGLKEVYETRQKLERLLVHIESSRSAKLKFDKMLESGDDSTALAQGLEELIKELPDENN